MTSITDIICQANSGSDTAVARLWKKCGSKLVQKAQRVVSRFEISSTRPEEIASEVFSQYTLWSRKPDSNVENRRKLWAILSLATVLRGRRIHRRDGVAKRPSIWAAEELTETCSTAHELHQLDVWEEYDFLLKTHPIAASVLPMLIDRKPIKEIAKELDTSVRSTYRLIAELQKLLAGRLYE